MSLCPADCQGSCWECLACMGLPQAPPPPKLLSSWDKTRATCKTATLAGDCWVTTLINSDLVQL
jgi:hypothetical protein